jgi:hypothetical protein
MNEPFLITTLSRENIKVLPLDSYKYKIDLKYNKEINQGLQNGNIYIITNENFTYNLENHEPDNICKYQSYIIITFSDGTKMKIFPIFSGIYQVENKEYNSCRCLIL